MLHLDLTEQDRAVLGETLDLFLSNLRYEIGDTSDEAYRNTLKERERVLEHVLAQLVSEPTGRNVES